MDTPTLKGPWTHIIWVSEKYGSSKTWRLKCSNRNIFVFIKIHIHEGPITRDPKTRKTDPAATSCCGWEERAICYMTSHSKGQVTSFKIVDFAVIWNSDPMAPKLSVPIFIKGKFRGRLFWGLPNLNRGICIGRFALVIISKMAMCLAWRRRKEKLFKSILQ